MLSYWFQSGGHFSKAKIVDITDTQLSGQKLTKVYYSPMLLSALNPKICL
jgi:hypothetical protein